MSSINKAFIAAYQKSAAQPSAPSKAGPRPHFVPPAATTQPAVESPRPVESVAPPAVTPPPVPSAVEAPVVVLPQPATLAPPRPITVVEHAHVGVRAPHANFAASQRPAAPVNAPLPPLEPAAVSSRPVILPMSGSSPSWRPVFEVGAFTWPELTDVLLQAAALQFRAAALDLIEASRRHRKVIAVTAARRGEGCTMVTMALAKALAEQQQRVILVDAHFDAPSLADNLGLATQVGWEDTLSGEKPLAEALVESLEDRLIVLPWRQAAAPDWRLSVSRLKQSFDELRRHCDIVLIDAGPFGDIKDRRHLLSWAAPCRVDRALVVRDLRTTTDDETTDIERRLHGCGIAQWNFVENFAA